MVLMLLERRFSPKAASSGIIARPGRAWRVLHSWLGPFQHYAFERELGSEWVFFSRSRSSLCSVMFSARYDPPCFSLGSA